MTQPVVCFGYNHEATEIHRFKLQWLGERKKRARHHESVFSHFDQAKPTML